jgi:putative SOS response-associated peptidase YedK
MCGRFLLTAPVEALRRLFGVLDSPNFPARYNIAPTQDSAVIRLNQEGGRELALMRFGLVPSWAKDLSVGASLINARSDGVATKPSFRAAFKQRRCLVAADGFYEWKPGPAAKAPKQPYLIARADRATFAFAGLWERWQGDGQTVHSFSIITTDANQALAPIHHRMPVILDPNDYGAWLDPKNDQPQALLLPAPDALMQAIPVSTRVNTVRNDDADCIAPLAEGNAPPKAAAPAQGSLF